MTSRFLLGDTAITCPVGCEGGLSAGRVNLAAFWKPEIQVSCGMTKHFRRAGTDRSLFSEGQSYTQTGFTDIAKVGLPDPHKPPFSCPAPHFR